MKRRIVFILLIALFSGLYAKQKIAKVVMEKSKNDDVSFMQKLINQGYRIVDVSYYEPEFPNYIVCTIIYEKEKDK